MQSPVPAEPWYAVRCILRSEPSDESRPPLYEERITLWRATSFEEAVERAEHEAREHAAIVGATYVKLAQAFHLANDGAVGDGDEVFSLMRESSLAPDDYLNRFFDTGTERQDNIQ